MLSIGSSIGKALNSFLVLELAALQMGSFKEHLFGIGRDLTTESFEDKPWSGRNRLLAELCLVVIGPIDLPAWT